MANARKSQKLVRGGSAQDAEHDAGPPVVKVKSAQERRSVMSPGPMARPSSFEKAASKAAPQKKQQKKQVQVDTQLSDSEASSSSDGDSKDDNWKPWTPPNLKTAPSMGPEVAALNSHEVPADPDALNLSKGAFRNELTKECYDIEVGATRTFNHVPLEPVSESGSDDSSTRSSSEEDLSCGSAAPPQPSPQKLGKQVEDDGVVVVKPVRSGKVMVEDAAPAGKSVGQDDDSSSEDAEVDLEAQDKESEQASVLTDSRDLCVVCQAANVSTAAFPCRHATMCRKCIEQVRERDNRCPICRSHIVGVVHGKFGKDTLIDLTDHLVTSTGEGFVAMGRQAVDAAYDKIRILMAIGIIASIFTAACAANSYPTSVTVFFGLIAVFVGYLPWFFVTVKLFEAMGKEHGRRLSMEAMEGRSPGKTLCMLAIIVSCFLPSMVIFFVPYALFALILRPFATHCLPYLAYFMLIPMVVVGCWFFLLLSELLIWIASLLWYLIEGLLEHLLTPIGVAIAAILAGVVASIYFIRRIASKSVVEPVQKVASKGWTFVSGCGKACFACVSTVCAKIVTAVVAFYACALAPIVAAFMKCARAVGEGAKACYRHVLLPIWLCFSFILQPFFMAYRAIRSVFVAIHVNCLQPIASAVMAAGRSVTKSISRLVQFVRESIVDAVRSIFG